MDTNDLPDDAEQKEGVEASATQGKRASGPAGEQQELPHARERAHFRALLITNPNYFGNLKLSPFKPVLTIQANTTYEEIGCVGFEPQLERLEAVVYVKQASGYGGGICSPGTPEYVRFYVSTDNGATWSDAGLTSFTAHDVPRVARRVQRLEYAVTLRFAPQKRFCFAENLALVRAILSWNAPPPPDDPNFVPVWGDIHDTRIQIEPSRVINIGELLEAMAVKAASRLARVLDLAEPVKVARPRPLALAELSQLYANKGVEPHRFALKELQQFIARPTFSATLMAPGGGGLWPDLKIDWPALDTLLNPTDGNTRYEELECIGLDPNLEALVGVIRVKLPNGYSGDLCTAGSREYVTFWADFNGDGVFEACLGTTSVNAYDIQSIPKEGLEYAVFLPVDLSRHRRPCQEGPVVARVRAILSWQVAPPCANPDYVPVWGNRLETLILVRPGATGEPGTHVPIIQTVGSMDVGDIDNLTGLANGPAVLAGFTAQDSPFGGEVIVTGHIANTPDLSSLAANLKYRVEVSADNGASWQRLTNSFTLKRDQLLDGVWSDLPDITQAVDADDWYSYQEDLAGGPGNATIFPVGNVLARWHTGGLSGLWKLRIRAREAGAAAPVWTSNVVTLMLDNTAPTAAVTITTGGGPCADFVVGQVVSGTYAVADAHFGALTLWVAPANGGSFTDPAPLPAGATMPLTRTYVAGVPTTGEAGGWSLDTTGMPRCGYVIHLDVADRTIRNSGFIGHWATAVVGLCLREPGT